MSLLRGFSFGAENGITELPVNVVQLFTGLAENPEKELDYVSEIVDVGLRNRLDPVDFNLWGYGYVIARNNKRSSGKRGRKQLALIDSNPEVLADGVGVGCITDEMLSKQSTAIVVDAYEEVIKSTEIDDAIKRIKQFSVELLIDEKVDLITAIKSAVRGIPEAVSELRRICEEYTTIGELVYTILDSGEPVDTIFA